jgi:predicted aconitase
MSVAVAPSVAEHAEEDWLYPTLGYRLGEVAGAEVALLEGLPPGVSEDRLKALGAGAATSGSVALIHVAGSTPEADLFDGRSLPRVTLDLDDIRQVERRLSTGSGPVDAVSLGAPHYSSAELDTVVRCLNGRSVRIPTYVNTSRDQIEPNPNLARDLAALGVTVVTDTCTYITPILDRRIKVVMTDSSKWAHYAPGNLGVSVVFAPLDRCLETAVGSV